MHEQSKGTTLLFENKTQKTNRTVNVCTRGAPVLTGSRHHPAQRTGAGPTAGQGRCLEPPPRKGRARGGDTERGPPARPRAAARTRRRRTSARAVAARRPPASLRACASRGSPGPGVGEWGRARRRGSGRVCAPAASRAARRARFLPPRGPGGPRAPHQARERARLVRRRGREPPLPALLPPPAGPRGTLTPTRKGAWPARAWGDPASGPRHGSFPPDGAPAPQPVGPPGKRPPAQAPERGAAPCAFPAEVRSVREGPGGRRRAAGAGRPGRVGPRCVPGVWDEWDRSRDRMASRPGGAVQMSWFVVSGCVAFYYGNFQTHGNQGVYPVPNARPAAPRWVI